MKVAFFEIKPWEKAYIKSKLKNHKLTFYEDELNIKNVKKAKNFDVISIFIYSEINNELIRELNVKAIATRSTGMDHIDLNASKAKGIKILNVPFYGESTVAEHTFALILALAKNLRKSFDRTRKENFTFEGLEGFDLKGKTLGIIGMGHIGMHVAKIAKGFEMNVIAFSKHKNKSFTKKTKFKYVTLKELLKNSDIITLHVPHNKETHHLINNKNINQIKKGAYIINTARGGIIDNTALIKALEKKTLAGAGLDVLEEEDLINSKKKKLTQKEKHALFENHKLLKYPNVVITPHNAFNTKGAKQRILDTTIKNIKSVKL